MGTGRPIVNPVWLIALAGNCSWSTRTRRTGSKADNSFALNSKLCLSQYSWSRSQAHTSHNATLAFFLRTPFFTAEGGYFTKSVFKMRVSSCLASSIVIPAEPFLMKAVMSFCNTPVCRSIASCN